MHKRVDTCKACMGAWTQPHTCEKAEQEQKAMARFAEEQKAWKEAWQEIMARPSSIPVGVERCLRCSNPASRTCDECGEVYCEECSVTVEGIATFCLACSDL